MYRDTQKELELLTIFADILGYKITRSKGIWHIWKNTYIYGIHPTKDKGVREFISFHKMVSLYNQGFGSVYRGIRQFNICKGSFNERLLLLPRKPLTIQRKHIRHMGRI
jgi:hypothetical protein